MSRSLSYRASAKSDAPLIREGFLSSYRTAHAAGFISMEDWHEVMTPQWQKVLDRPGVETIVAYHPGEESSLADLYGFITVSRDYHHKLPDKTLVPLPFVVYIYVKHNFRKKHGIAKGLFQAAGIDPTQPFHYACKTACVSGYKDAIPLAKWKPLPMRFPPKI